LVAIRHFRFAIVLLLASVLASCGGYYKTRTSDELRNLERKDFEDYFSRKKASETKKEKSKTPLEAPPIPEMSSIVNAPMPPKIGEGTMVSLSVTDDIPIRDVLLELARLAKVDLQIGQGIKGGIIFKATDRPFDEVAQRVCEMAGLRYTLKDGVLSVELDTPYMKSYIIDFLNMDRSSKGSLSIGGGTSGSESGGSGSTANIGSESKSDLWKSFESGLKSILAISETKTSKEKAPPKIAAKDSTNTQQNTPPPAAAPGTQPLAGQPPAGQPPANTNMPAQPPAAGANIPANFDPKAMIQQNLQRQSYVTPLQAAIPGQTPAEEADAPETPETPETPDATGATPTNKNKPFYIMNRQAGVLTVNATETQHKKIAEYVNQLKSNVSAQVLIEAKIVEVKLNKNFQSGIDWSAVLNSAYGIGTNTAINQISTDLKDSAVSFALNVSGAKNSNDFGKKENVDVLLKVVEQFGTSTTLASPRINAVNNQQAVLSFVENYTYFKPKITLPQPVKEANGTVTVGDPTVDIEQKSLPIGIILNILPSIDLVSNDITLNVKPTLSRIKSFAEDPFNTIIATLQTNPEILRLVRDLPKTLVPNVETKELDSIMKLKSGQVMVLGGLISDTTTNDDRGVPYANKLPVLGNFFTAKANSDIKSELVIFIRATIVPSSGSVSKGDQELYKKFTNDPNPLEFKNENNH